MEKPFFPGEELKTEELKQVIGGAEGGQANGADKADASGAQPRAK